VSGTKDNLRQILDKLTVKQIQKTIFISSFDLEMSNELISRKPAALIICQVIGEIDITEKLNDESSIIQRPHTELSASQFVF